MHKKRYQISCKRIPRRPQISFSTPHVTTPPKSISFADRQIETKRAASYVTKSTYMCIYYMYTYIYLYIILKGASPHCKILQRITTHLKANIKYQFSSEGGQESKLAKWCAFQAKCANSAWDVSACTEQNEDSIAMTDCSTQHKHQADALHQDSMTQWLNMTC